MTIEQYGTRSGVWATKDEPKQDARIGRVLAAAGGVLALLLALALGYRVGHRDVGSLQTQRDHLQAQLVAQRVKDHHTLAILRGQVHQLLTARGHCATYDGDARSIQRFLAKGQYRAAADLANLDLANPNKPACLGSGLAQLWYTASMDNLFASAPSSPADRTSVLTWRGIEARADQLGLGAGTRFSPLTVFTMAYNDHLWALALAAFQQAWSAALVGPADLSQLAGYYAALRNQGRELAQGYRGALQQEGYRLLATATAISKLAGLGQGEAASDLERLLGAQAGKIAPDRTDPILRRLQHTA